MKAEKWRQKDAEVQGCFRFLISGRPVTDESSFCNAGEKSKRGFPGFNASRFNVSTSKWFNLRLRRAGLICGRNLGAQLWTRGFEQRQSCFGVARQFRQRLTSPGYQFFSHF